MNSKRIVFLLLAVIVAGTTAFLARAWLQAERAAIAAQIGGPQAGRRRARGAGAGGEKRVAHRPAHQARGPALAAVAAGRAAADLHRRRQAAAHATSSAPSRAASFRVGQPVVETDIVMPGSRGFLAAVLQPGLRAVSVPATATTRGVGLHLCRRSCRRAADPRAERRGQRRQHAATETILRNARVIAMDQRLDFAPGDKPEVGKTATLELTAKQTEIVTLGGEDGRAVAGPAQPAGPDGGARRRGSGEDATAELGQATPTTPRSAG